MANIPRSHALNGLLPPPDIFIVAAILFSADGRYLLQLRDDKPGLPLRDHWALFGGEVDPDESADAAILREVEEELTYRASQCSWFHEAIYVLPRHRRRVVRKAFYTIEIEPSEVDDMVLCEGAALRLMTLSEILGLARVAPWDVGAILLHARGSIVFRE